LLLLRCTHVLTPMQQQVKKRGACREILAAADEARIAGDPRAAHDLALGCDQDRFLALVSAAPPAEALLLCGRARAAQQGSGDKPSCDGTRVDDLAARLRPHITIGPPDPTPHPEPALAAALAQLGAELNLAWDGEDPMVIVGRLTIAVEHQLVSTYASVPDATGRRRSVPATQHRLVARAEGQAELNDQTRTLRVNEEARDVAWDAVPRLGVAGRPEPQLPPEDALRTRAAAAWLRVLARNLAQSPPEGVDTDDARGCVAYAMALRAQTGDPDAAANGWGDAERVAACEKLLGLLHGAGLPLP
jgi:hypothetical protein